MAVTMSSITNIITQTDALKGSERTQREGGLKRTQILYRETQTLRRRRGGQETHEERGPETGEAK